MKSRLVNLESALEYSGCTLTYGHFSTIHPGHVRYLKHAKGLGKELVVALIGDNSKRDYPFSQKERAEALGLLGIADAILLLDSDELDIVVGRLRPSTLVLGNEFKEKQEIQSLLALQVNQGGAIQFHAGEVQYATADLLGGSERDIRGERRERLKEACRRQKVQSWRLLESIKEWEGTRLIVLGDVIVDQYAACEALGMSAEAPVVVVRELERKNFVGGAGVVAAHIRALGAQCNLVSVVGADSTAEIVKEELHYQGVESALIVDSSRPTTFKKRYVVENQKLFRVSRLENHNLDSAIEELIIRELRSLAKGADGLVISDFVYGVVTPRILEVIQELASMHDLMLFGDLQCSSQVGSVTRFNDFSLLCPNEREARLALQDRDTGLEQLSQMMLEQTRCERLVMKLGSEGFIAYDNNGDGTYNSQAFPALSVNPLDVAGAGDSLLAVFATGLASKQAMMDTAALACCMAALAVETMGNTPISAYTLQESLREILES